MSASGIPSIVFPLEGGPFQSVKPVDHSTSSTITPTWLFHDDSMSGLKSSRSRAPVFSRVSPFAASTALFQAGNETDNAEDTSLDVEKVRRSRRRWLSLNRYRFYHYLAIAINRIRRHQWMIVGTIMISILFHSLYSAVVINHPSNGSLAPSEVTQSASWTSFSQIHDKWRGYAITTRDHASVTPDEEIEALLGGAKIKWEEKVGRQSKTLKAAVDEYQRRYGQVPPKGFEYWWYYCV